MTSRARVVIGLLVVAVLVGVTVTALVLRDDDQGSDLTVALSGTGGSASGDIRKLPSGWRIELDAPDLPRLDGGEFYQAWLKNEAGTLVPIGTFNEGEGVVLWAGVSPLDYPSLTVTREDADNDQASSGDRVLTGEIKRP